LAEVTGEAAAPGGAESAERRQLMSRLRATRRRAALLVAIADIAGIWPLERVTGALSRFADAAIEAALRHLLATAIAEGEIAPPERGGSGVIILGMGKLGGNELNYSSDIDLIILFDGERVRYT